MVIKAACELNHMVWRKHRNDCGTDCICDLAPSSWRLQWSVLHVEEKEGLISLIQNEQC